MGFRFQRRIKLAPGVRLNISKSGISGTIGGRGLTYNTRGIVTAGVPGTGLSYRHNLNAPQQQGLRAQQPAAAPASPGSKRIAGGIVCCLLGSVVPVVSLLAIPLFISGCDARMAGR